MKTVVRLCALACLAAMVPLGATVLNFGGVIIPKGGYGELVQSGFDALKEDEISISGYQNGAGNPPDATATADENPTFGPLALGLALLAFPLSLRRWKRS